MKLPLHYITDAQGNKMSVVISYSDWLAFESNYKKIENKLAVLDSIKTGIKEVKNARKQGVALQSLEDFLNEY
jgi:cell fate (sporulation/competence/biofilm development) regulator YmcA (YheA/YmcA/DUF963 family)